mmetsp:Transcript_4016/g.7046  ORF Transcript_4016/g.7046 Transcript_4016/m.7046 type:complete len:147 (+) Transcript_4016:76-516(+)
MSVLMDKMSSEFDDSGRQMEMSRTCEKFRTSGHLNGSNMKSNLPERTPRSGKRLDLMNGREKYQKSTEKDDDLGFSSDDGEEAEQGSKTVVSGILTGSQRIGRSIQAKPRQRAAQLRAREMHRLKSPPRIRNASLFQNTKQYQTNA